MAKPGEFMGVPGGLPGTASPSAKTPVQGIPKFTQKPQQQKKWVSAGGCVIASMDKPDKVYIVKPANNYGPWTFPKGKVDPGESLREAAVREVVEETGLTAKIISSGGSNGYLGRGTGSYSVTHFFLMVKTGGTPTPNEESEAIKLVTWERAKEYFAKSGNKRDGAIADMAMETLRGMGLLK